jgi:hypothetical protein
VGSTSRALGSSQRGQSGAGLCIPGACRSSLWLKVLDQECLSSPKIDFLDMLLPLLVDTSPQTSTSIAQLIASAVRTPQHRTAVTDWLPLTDRIKEVKGKRGWEKPNLTKLNSPSRQGGWVVRNLAALLRSRDGKVPVTFSGTLQTCSFARVLRSCKKLHYLRWRP